MSETLIRDREHLKPIDFVPEAVLPRRLIPTERAAREPVADTVRSLSSAMLDRAAVDLDDAPAQPTPDAMVFERAVVTHNATIRENAELKEKVRRVMVQLDELTRGAASAAARAADKVELLTEQNAQLQRDRDIFAAYSAEIRTRMTNLTTVMAANAAQVEEAISRACNAMGEFVSQQVEGLEAMMLSNAATAKSLVEEALEAAKTETVAKLQSDRRA